MNPDLEREIRRAVRERLENQLLFQMQAAGLPTPRRELRFFPARRWRFDFAYPDRLLAIEVEGGTWTGGAHVRGAHYASDCRKYNTAAIIGWKLLRVTSDMIESGEALRTIDWALRGPILPEERAAWVAQEGESPPEPEP